MSEREKQVVEKLREAIPKMSDFDKGYILGKVENMSEESRKKKEEDIEVIKNWNSTEWRRRGDFYRDSDWRSQN